MNQYTVLVVEDDPLILESLIEMFEFKGFKINSARNGVEAMESVKKFKPNLIISDVMMPEMGGFELLRIIKSDPSTELIPMIMLTADVEMDSKLNGLELGADDYITKPFEFRELHLKVQNLIKRQEKLTQYLNLTTDQNLVSSQDLLFLKKLWVLLDENLTDSKFQIGFLANNLNMSSSTLQRRVKKVTGKTTVNVVKEYRLKKASELIKGNYGTLSEVAFKTGFNSLAYFSTCYKDFFGNNPKQDIPN